MQGTTERNDLPPVVGLLSATKKSILQRSQSTPARPRPQTLVTKRVYKLSANKSPSDRLSGDQLPGDQLPGDQLPGDRIARAGQVLGNIPELPSTPPPSLDKESSCRSTGSANDPVTESENTRYLYKEPNRTQRSSPNTETADPPEITTSSLVFLTEVDRGGQELVHTLQSTPFSITVHTPESTPLSQTVSTQTRSYTMEKIRISNKMPLSKTLPFLFVATFLLLLGTMLITVGVMMEWHWVYHIATLYKPYWTGALVTTVGISLSVFCCVRTPKAAVVVTVMSIPALATSIFQVILAGLMARAITPQTDQYFCTSSNKDDLTLLCDCVEDISFNVTVKSAVSSAAVNESCEDEMRFIFELMLAVTCVCVALIFLLFVYIFWVFCAVTSPSYKEHRRTLSCDGTMPHAEVQRQRGTLTSPLVLSNNQHGEMVPSRAASRASIGVPMRAPSRCSNGAPSRPLSMVGGCRGDEIPSRTLSITGSSGLRPVVTVQKSHSGLNSPALSRSGTWNHNRAAPPPPAEHVLAEDDSGPDYHNADLHAVRAGEIPRAWTPSDTHTSNHTSTSGTPVLLPRVVKSAPKVTSYSVENLDDEVSSEDNNNEVILDLRASPKQVNLLDKKNRQARTKLEAFDY